MRKYTREQLIFYLKKLSGELKRTPTINDLNKSRHLPSSTTYLNRFRGWNNALKASGLKINVKQQYKKEELLENIRILAKELQRMPQPKDLKGKKWAGSYATFKKHFGNWKTAIKQADIEFNGGSRNLKTYSKKKSG